MIRLEQYFAFAGESKINWEKILKTMKNIRA